MPSPPRALLAGTRGAGTLALLLTLVAGCARAPVEVAVMEYRSEDWGMEFLPLPVLEGFGEDASSPRGDPRSVRFVLANDAYTIHMAGARARMLFERNGMLHGVMLDFGDRSLRFHDASRGCEVGFLEGATSTNMTTPAAFRVDADRASEVAWRGGAAGCAVGSLGVTYRGWPP